MQPATIIPEIALVSDISGVCKAGETFQITKYPVKTARRKIPNLLMNDELSVKIPTTTQNATAKTKMNNAYKKSLLMNGP